MEQQAENILLIEHDTEEEKPIQKEVDANDSSENPSFYKVDPTSENNSEKKYHSGTFAASAA